MPPLSAIPDSDRRSARFEGALDTARVFTGVDSAWAAATANLTAPENVPRPAWSTDTIHGRVERLTLPTCYGLDELGPSSDVERPSFTLQLGLAGWGNVRARDGVVQKLSPGTAWVTTNPSQYQCVVPQQSPGWTFAWVRVWHPYVVERIAASGAASGLLLDLPPDRAVTAHTLRLVRGAVRNDFRDAFEAELCLFECVLALQRWTRQSQVAPHDRIMDRVRSIVAASLPGGISLRDLAAEFGMSRCYFSHRFREQTGLALSHFVMTVRVDRAAEMLIGTRDPLKTIADACGFANVSHFGKVFRRFRSCSPAAFRRTGC